MTKLSDCILQQKLLETPEAATTCPYCAQTEGQKLTEHSQTAIGSIGPDRNHHWYHYECGACQCAYTREIKSGNVWYTRMDDTGSVRVLFGQSNCFENYIYTCNHPGCGADLHRRYYDAQGQRSGYVVFIGGVAEGHYNAECDNGHITRLTES